MVLNPERIQNKEISMESFTPWTDRQIEDEIERIKPTPSNRDILILFLQFLDSQSHLLFRYGNNEGYLLQQAYNYAGSGPFASYVDDYIKKCKDLNCFLHRNNGKSLIRLIPVYGFYRNILKGFLEFQLPLMVNMPLQGAMITALNYGIFGVGNVLRQSDHISIT